MRPTFMVICLLGTTFKVEPSYLHGAGSLYDNYQGEYAATYDNYEPRAYAFEYGVSDPHTGDHKTQWETKDKEGVVRGSYSLLEPDGSTRIVDYIADDHGFRAVVRKVGIHGHLEKIEGHGGAEASVAEAPVTHLETQPIVAAYNSYDGGVEDYSNLQPLTQNVYSAPSVDIHQIPQQILQEPLYFGAQQQQILSGGYLGGAKLLPQQQVLSEGYLGGGKLVQQPIVAQEYLGGAKLALGEGIPQQLLSKIAVPEQNLGYISQGALDCDQNEKLTVSYGQKEVQPQILLSQQPVVLSEQKLVVPQQEYQYVARQPILLQQQEYVAKQPVVLQQQEYVAKQPVLLQQQEYVAKQPVLLQQQEYVAKQPVAVPQQQQAYLPETKFTIGKEALSYVADQKIDNQNVFYSPETLNKGVEWSNVGKIALEQVPQQQLVADNQKLGPAYSYVQKGLVSLNPQERIIEAAPKEVIGSYESLAVAQPLAGYNLDVNYGNGIKYGGYGYPAPC